MNKSFIICSCLVLPFLCSWINYDDKVKQTPAVFGKEFRGFSLKISTEKVEFEQDLPIKIKLLIRNNNKFSTLVKSGDKARYVQLHLVVVDYKKKMTLFSNNLFSSKTDLISTGQIPALKISSLKKISSH